jgi:uncharacterized protein
LSFKKVSSLKIDITPLLDNPERTLTESGEWPGDQIDLDSESFSLDHPLTVEITLTNDGGVIEVAGRYDTRLTALCGRCLTEYERDIDGEVQARFLGSEDELREEKEAAEEPIYYGLIRDNQVDVGSVVRQDVLVQCPMRPLCREDCEGLCPVCGINLNEEDCGHEQQSGDPRMARFRELAEDQDESEDLGPDENPDS